MEAMSNHGKGVANMLAFTIILMSYMALVTYFGIFYLRIFGFYGFWEKQTAGVTLLNSALYASKLTFPMTFNFMLMFFKSYHQKSDFVIVSKLNLKINFLGYWESKRGSSPRLQPPSIHPSYPGDYCSFQLVQYLWKDSKVRWSECIRF